MNAQPLISENQTERWKKKKEKRPKRFICIFLAKFST